MKKGLDVLDYFEQIDLELERICFNLIMLDNIHTLQPYCTKSKIGTTKNQTPFEDTIALSEVVTMRTKMECESFYAEIAENKNFLLNSKKYKYYKTIFDILQCPNFVIQYMALYEMLETLLSPKGKKGQKFVIVFFENNSSRYNYPTKQTRRKNRIFTEDFFTYLRNEIGYPCGLTDKEIKELGVNERTVKSLLSVINDVLCENVSF